MKYTTSGTTRKKTFLFLSLFFTFIIFISLFSFILTAPISRAAELQEEDTEFELVQGYFTEIRYSGEADQTSLGLSHPEYEKTYNWVFSDGEWSGDIDYLLEDDTYHVDENSEWVVTIAVDHDAPLDDDWTLILDDEEHGVEIVEPSTAVGISGGLNFLFDPYSEDATATDSIRVINEGNIPMTYEIEYTDTHLSHQKDQEVIRPSESGNPTFTYEYSTTDPEAFSPDISITAYFQDALDLEADGNTRVTSRSGFGVSTRVTVGYEGVEQEIRDGYSVQYTSSLQVPGNTYHEATFYVYPNEEVVINFYSENVSFEDDNITVIPLDSEGNRLDEIDFDPNSALSPEYGEVEITVEFKSDRENDGFIGLEVGRDRYTTNIQLTETAPQPGDEEVSFVEEEAEKITLGIVLIGGILAFGAARILLSKKKED